MKIAHLVIDGSMAGGQLVALRLARAARDRGDDVLFVLPTGGRLEDRLAAEGFDFRLVPIHGALDVRALLRLRALLRRERVELVHTHGHLAVNVVGRVAGRLAGARVVSQLHADNVFRPGRFGRMLQVALDNATARLCTHLVAVSEHTRRGLVEQGYPRRRTVTVPNGIDAVAPADPVELDAGPRLVAAGRLDAAKGYEDLVDALALLGHADAIAYVAGEDGVGAGRSAALAARAAQRGVGERLRLLGHRDDVPSLLAAADVVVVPSRAEAFGLVALEAMAAGKPVVATRVGGLPEVVVDGETGVLVQPGDPAALAGAIDGLLDDPERARRLGAAGRVRAREHFDAARATARVLALYAA